MRQLPGWDLSQSQVLNIRNLSQIKIKIFQCFVSSLPSAKLSLVSWTGSSASSSRPVLSQARDPVDVLQEGTLPTISLVASTSSSPGGWDAPSSPRQRQRDSVGRTIWSKKYDVTTLRGVRGDGAGPRPLTSFNFPDQSVSTAPPNSGSSWLCSSLRTRDFSGPAAGWGGDPSSGPQDDRSPQLTGQTRAGPAGLSRTTGRATRAVWPSWTISTRTGSSSTMSPVATGSRSSARPEPVSCYCLILNIGYHSHVFIVN